PPEESVCPVEFTATHQDPATVAFHKWTPTVISNLVSHQRAQIAADCSNGRDHKQVECPLKNEVSRKRHDQLRRQRDTCRLDSHQDGDSGISRDTDDFADENKQDRKDSFSHIKAVARGSYSAFRENAKGSPNTIFQCSGKNGNGCTQRLPV